MDDVIILRPSGKYVLLRLVVTLFSIETVYALLFAIYFILRPGQEFTKAILLTFWVAHTIKFIILTFFISDIIIRYLSMHYYITKHHLIVNRGIVNNEEKVYELQQVRKISIFQDYLGKRLNYGSVQLLLGARGFEEHITLSNITTPRIAVKEIEQYLGTSEAASTTKPN